MQMRDLHKRAKAILRSEESKFHTALGQLTLAWAEAESALYKVLLRYTKVSSEVGRAIFPGTRASGMTENLGRIMANVRIGKARESDLKFLLEQMGTINTMRDRITHNGRFTFMAQLSEVKIAGWTFINNEERAPRKDKAFMHRVDVSMLDSMILDLSRIREGLERHSRPGRGFIPRDGSGQTSTWLYRFPQPEPTRAPSRGNPQGSKLRLQSSRASPRKES